MKIKLDPEARMPTRAHNDDAGLDLYARDTLIVWAGKSEVFDTGVHIALPKDTVGYIKSKSGLCMNHGIITTGTIDEGYTGSIKVKLFNLGDRHYVVNKGDKIAQLVIHPILKPDLELVDELEDTERGNNGFGSSGR